MVITYHGDNYFKLLSGGKTLLLDPTNQRSFRGANLVINTIRPTPVDKPSGDEVFCIDHPGEYEVGGVKIMGIQNTDDSRQKNVDEKTIYKVEFENIYLAFLGYLTKEPAAETQEFLNGIDVIILPGGGKPYILEVAAAKFVRQLEPSLVIPSLFKNPNKFLKEFGKERSLAENKLVIKKKELKMGEMKIVCLKE